MAVLINILFVSIPEGICILLLALVYMGRSDLVKMTRTSAMKMLCFAAVTGTLSNILKLYTNINSVVLPFIFITLMCVLVVLLYRLFLPMQIAKCVLGVIFSYITFSVIQISYTLVLFSCTNITTEDLNTPGVLLIWVTLPERLIEITTIALLLMKSKSLYKINPIKLIVKDWTAFVLVSIFFLLNVGFIFLMIEGIYRHEMLKGLPLYLQSGIALSIIVLPFCNIAILFYIVYWILYSESMKRNFIYDESRVFSALISILIKHGRLKDALEETKKFEAENRKYLKTERKGELP